MLEALLLVFWTYQNLQQMFPLFTSLFYTHLLPTFYTAAFSHLPVLFIAGHSLTTVLLSVGELEQASSLMGEGREGRSRDTVSGQHRVAVFRMTSAFRTLFCYIHLCLHF